MHSGKWCKIICSISMISMVALVISCADRYIGRQVDPSQLYSITSLPETYFMGDEDDYLAFEITFSRGEAEGEYIMEGYVDPTVGKAKSWDTFQTKGCHYSVLLAKNGVITDRVSFSPSGNSLGRKLPFKKKFQTAPFDAFTIIWKIVVRG